MSRTPYVVTETERNLLAGEARRTGLRQDMREQRQFGILVALAQHLLEFELNIEIVFDHTFATAGHEYEMFDAGFRRFIDHILDDRLVDDRQHFFWHSLCGRQEAGAEARNREDCFTNFPFL